MSFFYSLNINYVIQGTMDDANQRKRSSIFGGEKIKTTIKGVEWSWNN